MVSSSHPQCLARKLAQNRIIQFCLLYTLNPLHLYSGFQQLIVLPQIFHIYNDDTIIMIIILCYIYICMYLYIHIKLCNNLTSLVLGTT